MAKQFSKSISRSQQKTALANVQFDENLSVQPDSVQITSWLSRLHLLYGIPFHYLVPDIRMLPDESIRFFQVDDNWINALIDGAYSPGTSMATATVSQALQPQMKSAVSSNLFSVRAEMLGVESTSGTSGIISGFLLRSAVVSGWPGVEVTGYNNPDGSSDHQIQILRLERISPTLLLCLFDGLVARADFREPAETIHFDFDYASRNSYQSNYTSPDYYVKNYRYVKTEGTITAGSESGGFAVVDIRDNRTVDINALANHMNTGAWPTEIPQSERIFTSAEFALSMVQNTDIVTFKIEP